MRRVAYLYFIVEVVPSGQVDQPATEFDHLITQLTESAKPFRVKIGCSYTPAIIVKALSKKSALPLHLTATIACDVGTASCICAQYITKHYADGWYRFTADELNTAIDGAWDILDAGY